MRRSLQKELLLAVPQMHMHIPSGGKSLILQQNILQEKFQFEHLQQMLTHQSNKKQEDRPIK